MEKKMTLAAYFTQFISAVGIPITLLIILVLIASFTLLIMKIIDWFERCNNQKTDSNLPFPETYLNIKFEKREQKTALPLNKENNIRQWKLIKSPGKIFLVLETTISFPENIFITIKPLNCKLKPSFEDFLMGINVVIIAIPTHEIDENGGEYSVIIR